MRTSHAISREGVHEFSEVQRVRAPYCTDGQYTRRAGTLQRFPSREAWTRAEGELRRLNGQIAVGFAGDDLRPGKMLAPRFSGVLSAVRLGLQTSGTVNAIVEIRTVVNGLPTTTIIHRLGGGAGGALYGRRVRFGRLHRTAAGAHGWHGLPHHP